MTGFSGTVINTYVQTLVDTVCAMGADRDAVLQPLIKENVMLDKPGERLPINLMTRLWQRTAELTGDPDLGLHVGETIRPGTFHILAPVIMNCRTLEETIDVMITFQSLVSEGGILKSNKTSRGIELIYTPGPFAVPMTRFQVECIFSGIATFARWLLNRDLPLTEVRFRHRIEHSETEYHRIFRCPVMFSQPENVILFSEENLSLPIPYADPDLRKHHQKVAERLMASLTFENKVVQDLTDCLLMLPHSGRVSLDQAADYMKMSPRTLQRKLKNANTSFHDVQTSVLMSMAHELLLRTDKTVSIISEELGYLNTSSFHRRFRRWYSMTPHEYRSRVENLT